MRKVEINDRVFDSYICKYYTIDTDFYNSILNNYLWFSDPNDFNDPYDVNPIFELPNYKEDDLNILAEIIDKKGYLNGKTYNEIVKYYSNPDNLKKALKDFRDKFVPNIGICCFSQTEDILLMWSHYANKHKGICLKFDMDKDEPFFKIPIKVDYLEKPPSFDFIHNRENVGKTAQLFVGTKSIDWKYENEIRIVKYKQAFDSFRGKINFNKSSLIEMIFGYKIEKQTITNLMTLMKGIGYDCSFSRVNLKKNEFGLEKIIINQNTF